MAGNLYTGTLDLLILRTLQGEPVPAANGRQFSGTRTSKRPPLSGGGLFFEGTIPPGKGTSSF
jgi:hypothetical protein